MEPLTALGLASNILACVQFAGQIISQGREIYKSTDGASDEVSALQETARNLSRINHDLPSTVQSHRSGGSEREYELEEGVEGVLQRLSDDMRTINDEIISRVGSLQKNGSRSRLGSVKLALKTVWEQDEIQELEKRLGRVRDNLTLGLLVSMRDKLQSPAHRDQAHAAALERDLQRRYDEIRDKLESSARRDEIHMAALERDLQRRHDEIIMSIHGSGWQLGDVKDNISQLRASIPVDLQNSISAQLSASAEIMSRERFNTIILSSLKFRDMGDRYERIPEAYQKTFEWIFKGPKEQRREYSCFISWLQDTENTNLYWITGKAGSGKSTLMKFAFNDSRTKKDLQVWAGCFPLVQAAFFFWNSGTEMQMSKDGLLRSLLHQIFSSQPQLSSAHLSELWESYQSLGRCWEEWTWGELKAAFHHVISDQSVRCAFFIDGLDEFDGDHEELVAFVLEIAGYSNVKVCVASRPWLVFEDAFENKPNLQLEWLTEEDIRGYVLAKFNQNKDYHRLIANQHDFATGLVDTILRKASGVFLWVYLVVQSLLQGMKNADRASELQTRLDDLPEDLEHLFQKLLCSLDKFYYEQACQMITLVSTSPKPPGLLIFYGADEKDESVILEAPIEQLGYYKLLQIFEDTRRRVQSRCKGLLELVSSADGTASVTYLHRTVKDFLAQPRISRQIREGAGDSFNAYRRLAHGHLFELKHWFTYANKDPEERASADKNYFSESLLWTLEYALQSQNQNRTGDPLMNLLSSLESLLQRGNLHFWEGLGLIVEPIAIETDISPLSLLLTWGHHRYVQAKIDSGSQYFEPHAARAVTDYLMLASKKQRHVEPSILKQYPAIRENWAQYEAVMHHLPFAVRQKIRLGRMSKGKISFAT